MIRIGNLRVRKHDQEICHLPELSVADKGRLAIFGENGSGKSTLLRVLAGLESDFAGQCDIAVPPTQRVFTHQSPCLFRGDVSSNVAYGLTKAARRSRKHIEWMEHFEIAHLAKSNVRTLSGGEQRRVALARAFAVEPCLLLLDEPFTELDETGTQLAFAAMQSLSEAAILVTSPIKLELAGDWQQHHLATAHR